MTETGKRKTPAPKIDAAREWLEAAGSRGLTWQDYATLTGAHHGSASGMLSRLHKEGDALRLAEKRDGASVYVAPEFREGRDIVAPRPPRAAAPASPAETPDLEAVRRDAYAEGVVAGRAHERAMGQRRAAEHEEGIRLAGFAEGVAQGEADIIAVRGAAFEEGRAQGIEEGRAEGTSQSSDAAYHDGYRAGREQAEAQWQEGYDEGVRAGAESAVADLKRRMSDAGGEPYLKGREIGRREGEAMIRKHVSAVAIEMIKVISEGEPVRAHFNGCYKIHVSCAVKALARGAGVEVRELSHAR